MRRPSRGSRHTPALLIGNTAIPAWTGACTDIDIVRSVGRCIARAHGVRSPLVRRFALATKAAELVASRGVEAQLGAGVVGAPGCACLRVAGALGTAAGLLMRFAIHEAGRASAANPRATLSP